MKRAAGREKYGLDWSLISENLLYSLEFSDDFDTLVSAQKCSTVNWLLTAVSAPISLIVQLLNRLLLFDSWLTAG